MSSYYIHQVLLKNLIDEHVCLSSFDFVSTIFALFTAFLLIDSESFSIVFIYQVLFYSVFCIFRRQIEKKSKSNCNYVCLLDTSQYVHLFFPVEISQCSFIQICSFIRYNRVRIWVCPTSFKKVITYIFCDIQKVQSN